MNENELRAALAIEERAVEVKADDRFPDKVAISVISEGGNWSQVDTLRMTRVEAVKVYAALGAFLDAR